MICHAKVKSSFEEERADSKGKVQIQGTSPAVTIFHEEAVDAALEAEEAQLAPESAPAVADYPVRLPVLLSPACHLSYSKANP